MRNYIFVILTLLLSGCLSPYSYNSISNSDPTIIFGDRFKDEAGRSFAINSIDATSNKCKDFMNIGGVSNDSKFLDKSKTIKTPEGKTVAIRGGWHSGYSNCAPPTRKFTPASGGKYSVDIGTIGNKCFLSIAQIDTSGKIEEIKDFGALPKCE